MTSEDTAMPILDFIMKPSILPPRPMMMWRRAWAQKSMIQPISKLLGSMFRRFRFRLASWASS